jgi:hypothetical protein
MADGLIKWYIGLVDFEAAVPKELTTGTWKEDRVAVYNASMLACRGD